MSWKTTSYGSALLLAGAVLLAAPSFALAQRGGGGHGGGHMGGGYAGGFHEGSNFGGYHGGNFGRIYHGGSNFGGYRGGIYNGGFRHYGGFGYPYYYPYYGSYGYGYPYYGYDYYPYDYSTYSYPNYDSGYYGSAADGVASAAPSAGNYPTLPPPARGTYQSDASAHITVKLPADGQIWFDGVATRSSGAVREFDSPPLAPGSNHTYQVQARWTENGHEMSQSQPVEVTAGAHVNVEFPAPSQTAGQASAGVNR